MDNERVCEGGLPYRVCQRRPSFTPVRSLQHARRERLDKHAGVRHDSQPLAQRYLGLLSNKGRSIELHVVYA